MWFKKRTPGSALYRHYATLNPRTCERCLERHGRLFADLQEAPPLHPGCRCGFLPLEEEDPKTREQRGTAMRKRADAERRRRALFARALELPGQDLPEALRCLRAAVTIDLHLEELEALERHYRDLLQRDAALRRSLCRLFVQAYFDKLDQPRYRWIPPGWYAQLEQQGRQRIQALFSDPLAE